MNADRAMLPLAREIIFFREKWGITYNVCVYDGCGFRSRVLSPWVNEIKKTKLHTNTSPRSWHKHVVTNRAVPPLCTVSKCPTLAENLSPAYN